MIYADILFVINFFITLLLLRVTAKLAKRDIATLRLVLASAFGGGYAGVIFLSLPPVLSTALKIASAFIITAIAFRFHRLKSYCLTALLFLFSSFIFLGIITAALLVFKKSPMTVHNTAVYFDISARELLVCALIAYLLSCLVVRLYNRRVESDGRCVLRVIHGGREVRLVTLLDTGNRLREPFSDAPVIVADAKRVGTLFDGAQLRIIPTATVNAQSFLTAYKPERIVLQTAKGEREIEHAYLALSEEMHRSDCAAVMSPEILSL